MNKILRRLFEMEKNLVNEEAYVSYKQLVNIEPRFLNRILTEPTEKNKNILLLFDTLLGYGFINSLLTEPEKQKIAALFNNKALSKIYFYKLSLFEKYIISVMPYIKNHPLVKEITMLDDIVPLAVEQDDALNDVLDSIPISKYIYIPINEWVKFQLTVLADKIAVSKDKYTEYFFQNIICQNIEKYIRMNNLYLINSELCSYCLERKRSQCNIEYDIRIAHQACLIELNPILNNPKKDAYIKISDKINEEHEKYADNLIKTLKYRSKN